MTDSIMDNQNLTADILNAVSVDLGGDDLSFTTTEKFGADKLNRITADLTGAGILHCGDNCRVMIANGNVYVKSGIIVFADGKKKSIESDTLICSVHDCKIYAVNNIQENKIEIITADDFPLTGDFVKLASVSNGAVIDCRSVSIAKVSGLGTRAMQWMGQIMVTPTYKGENSVEVGQILGDVSPGVIFGTMTVEDYYQRQKFFMYDMASGKYYQSLGGTRSGWMCSEYVTGSIGSEYGGKYTHFTFDIIDSVLYIRSENNGDTTCDCTFDITVV